MMGAGSRENRENKEISSHQESRKAGDGRQGMDSENDVESRKDRGRRKGREKTVTLSRRMRMLADMVTAGSCVVDVGCDHGFLPIYLVQTGKCPKCLAMDVRKGPLSSAEEHIASWGLGEYIETRLSDGLAAYHTGEAQSLICAGMGGRLMEKILTEGGDKSRSFQELILQPQSEIPEFRVFLRKEGFLVTGEDAVYEDGKFYFAMKAVYTGQEVSPEQIGTAGQQDQPAGGIWTAGKQSQPAGQIRLTEQQIPFAEGSLALDGELPTEQGELMDNELYDLYGKQLLLEKHPVLKQYLLKRLQAVEEIITQLHQADSIKGEARVKELSREKEHLDNALEIYEKGR